MSVGSDPTATTRVIDDDEESTLEETFGDNTMLVIHQQYQVFEGEEDEDRSRYTINNDAMHALFTTNLSPCRDSSLYRIRMIEILTRRTECPVWDVTKILKKK